MSHVGRRIGYVIALVLGCGSTACSPSGSNAGRTRVSVFAASSLTEAFGEIERAFEATHPGIDVQSTFAGSQILRLQIEQGAAADAFASADEDHMRALERTGRVEAVQTFAHNALAVIVPLQNPAGIESVADLPRATRIVLGTPSVPVGRYTRAVLDRAGARFGPEYVTSVMARVVSEENNTRLVRAKVELGEADAAIVYRTDAIASDRVRSVPIPPDLNVTAHYLIAPVVGRARDSSAFVDFVGSESGRRSLERHGFETGGR